MIEHTPAELSIHGPPPPARRAFGWARLGLADWLPLAAAPAAVLGLQSIFMALPWVFMWALAFAIYMGCKWLTLRDALVGRRSAVGKTGAQDNAASTGRCLAYMLAYPNMDAKAFLFRRHDPQTERGRWIMAAMRVLFGAAMFWGVARWVAGVSILLAGWVGMIGAISMLHFGVFDLLTLAWRSRGVAASSLMQSPTRATSLSDFWGKRWNTAFRMLAHAYLFHPLHRRWGASAAMMISFIASGLIHDLVISLPAGAGFGLPTAYFCIQGVGVAFERSPIGRRLGLGRGSRGRIWVLCCAGLPAPLLFHGWFVETVFTPFMRFAGAL